jgi:ectoine hydroxylase-related dioxygenase (phytanoyl-CoA dioxygenase family)
LKIFNVNANHLSQKKILTKLVSKFNADGVVILNNFHSKKKCNKYKKLLNFYYKKYNKFIYKEKKTQKFSGLSGAKMVTNLHNKNVQFLKFLDNKLIIKIVEKLLQQGSYMNKDPIICQALTARSPLEKSDQQQLHNDARIVGSKYPLVVQVMFIIDDFTKENGATNFFLGSQKLLKFPKNNYHYKNLQTAEAKAGSVIIFNGATWHGSSKPKRIVGDRWAVVTRYSRWFLKPTYNFLFNTPINIFNKMNKAQKDLLGFRYFPPLDEFSGNKMIHKKYFTPKNYKLPQ